MRNLLFLLMTVFALAGLAQLPPSNMYENLGVYKSVAVYDDGEEVSFTGVDYFYLDFTEDGDVYIISWCPQENDWLTSPATLVAHDSDASQYEGQNGSFEDIVFRISPDMRDLVLSKDGSDLVVAYELMNSGGVYSAPYYNSGYYGGYNSSGSSSSASGRTCSSCSGTGKCKTCDGKGWYYHETGYYTGRSGKTRTDCPVCHATGKCGTCHGSGHIR